MGLLCPSSGSTHLLLPVVRQGQVVASSAGLFIVVHECVQVWKVAVQIDISGVPSAHQVAIKLWALFDPQTKWFSNRSYFWVNFVFFQCDWVTYFASWDLRFFSYDIKLFGRSKGKLVCVLHKPAQASGGVTIVKMFSNMLFPFWI